MEPLIIEVSQTLMVCVNIELSLKQIVAPIIYFQEDSQVFLFIHGQPLITFAEWLADISNRVTVLL